MVGLRWWNQITDDGNSVWQFESRADRTTIHKGEWTAFWGGLVIFTLFWIAVGLKNLVFLGWDWLIVDIVGVALCGANLGGYLKCANAARALSRAATQYAVSYAVSDVQGRLGGGGNSGSSSNTNSNDFN